MILRRSHPQSVQAAEQNWDEEKSEKQAPRAEDF
jgi:hypothetical protein